MRFTILFSDKQTLVTQNMQLQAVCKHKTYTNGNFSVQWIQESN